MIRRFHEHQEEKAKHSLDSSASPFPGATLPQAIILPGDPDLLAGILSLLKSGDWQNANDQWHLVGDQIDESNFNFTYHWNYWQAASPTPDSS